MEENILTSQKKIQHNVTLYDCVKLFIETMDNKFPDTCENSAIFLISSDGKKVSGMFNGSEDLIRDMIAYHLAKDRDLRSIVGDALVAAIKHLKDEKK